MMVMNDRSQAGTAYHTGRIELLINRELYSHDKYGLSENLNEANISAVYYLQFTNDRTYALANAQQYQIKRLMKV